MVVDPIWIGYLRSIWFVAIHWIRSTSSCSWRLIQSVGVFALQDAVSAGDGFLRFAEAFLPGVALALCVGPLGVALELGLRFSLLFGVCANVFFVAV